MGPDRSVRSQEDEKLCELNWEDYRTRYGNIQRLDLILEAENDSANRYKLSKQADVLMLFYLFSAEELREIFERLDYPFEYETILRNVALMVSEEISGRILPPTVPIISKVGAGDSMVAGIVLSLARGKPLMEAVLFGVATGTAAVMTPGTELCRREDAERLYEGMVSVA
jgi:hypothetical protein